MDLYFMDSVVCISFRNIFLQLHDHTPLVTSEYTSSQVVSLADTNCPINMPVSVYQNSL